MTSSPVGIKIQSIYEVHLTVGDRRISVDFYRDVLGFEVAHESDDRDYSFLWMGARGERMLGLWGPHCPDPPISRGKHHFAMGVALSDLKGAIEKMKRAGVTPLDFNGRAQTADLVVLAWMPAAAVYFEDPDGHSLEFISMLPKEPRPDLGVLNFREWEKRIRIDRVV